MKGLSEVAMGAHYKARLYFKPIDIGIIQQFESKGKQNNVEDIDWWTKLEKHKHEPPRYPADWVCVESEFALLCVTNLQWIAEDSMMGGKDFNGWSNSLRLVWSRKTGRYGYAQILLGL